MYAETQDPVRFRTKYRSPQWRSARQGDSAIYLLNPETVTPDGEWEAWLFANCLPGAQPNRSFAESMQAEHQSFRELS